MRQAFLIIPVAAGLSFTWSGVAAERPTISTYGTPGVVELPSGESFQDGELSFSSSVMLSASRNALTFQIFPRVSGTFRYSIVREFFKSSEFGDGAIDNRRLFDRSFDVQFALADQESFGADVAIGMRDLLGTGINSSEYIAVSRKLNEKLSFTAGLGWGRLAGRNSFDNPLGMLSDDFNSRSTLDFEQGGQLSSNQWFRGDASLFGGVDWRVTDRTSVQLEYSTDLYERELEFSEIDNVTPINAAFQYRFKNDATIRGYIVGGENIGVQFNFFLDPQRRVVPGGTDTGLAPVIPRDIRPATLWTDTASTRATLEDRLAAEGLRLDDLVLQTTSATVYIQNQRWDVEAQAAGRAARVMAQALPASVEAFTVIFQENGLPVSSVVSKRSDLEDFQYDYEGSWRTLSRSNIEGAGVPGKSQPRLTYALSPYFATSYFEPESPIRADVGPQLDVSYRPAPGLNFSGRFRYPLAGNLGDSVRESDSVLPRVRSEAFLYAREADFEINKLSAEYLWRPGDDTFARISAGLLESHFGGVSAEVLWRPIHSRTAYGVEVNYVQQRDFDMLFDFQDYDVVTGHASVYHDFGNGYEVQVDAGRYLAGDWGATFGLDREFNNGVRIGGFFTLTDVPFEDFGEGSFDKAIEIEFPLSYFTGNASRRQVAQTIRPILRDGGARLSVENRLYDVTSNYAAPELADGWGLYLR